MGVCCVVGCSKRTIKDTVSFYRFPTNPKRRKCPRLMKLTLLRQATWLARIGRKVLFERPERLKYERVCSIHFVSGRPSDVEKVNDQDWAPSQNLGHNYCSNRMKRNATGIDFQFEKSTVVQKYALSKTVDNPESVENLVCCPDINQEQLSDSEFEGEQEPNMFNDKSYVSVKDDVVDSEEETTCKSNNDTVTKDSHSLDSQDANLTIIYLKTDTS